MNKATHKLVNYSTLEVIHREYTYDEWFEAIWSDGASNHWMITVDGVDYYDYGVARSKSHQHAGNYPMASYAVGVGASQVPEQREADLKAGVPTEYTSEGDPIFTSRGHRKKYLKHIGFHDRNSYDGN
jgi:hypothetical protein